jgi:hypothetical protein
VSSLGARSVFVASLIAAVLALPATAIADPPLRWTAPMLIDHQPPFNRPAPLESVSCPSARLCFALDRRGHVLSSDTPTGGVGAWTRTTIGPRRYTAGAADISCPSRRLCVVVGSGVVFTSTDPAGPDPAWSEAKLAQPSLGSLSVSCRGASFCVATMLGTEVLVSSDPTGGPGAWSAVSVPHLLEDASCPSRRLCVGVGAGRIYRSTNPLARDARWTSFDAHDPPGQDFTLLYGIDCPSLRLCVAVGGDGDVFSTNRPTGGARSWKATRVGFKRGPAAGQFPTYLRVSCAGTRLCVAAGLGDNALATSTRPRGSRRAWRLGHVHRAQLGDLSCPSRRLCTVASSRGRLVTSTHPSGGPRRFHSRQIAGHNRITSVSCPVQSLCLATDDVGRVLSSTDPGAGASAWSTDPPTAVQGAIGNITCPTASLCVASADYGRVAASTDPTGADTWTTADADLSTSRKFHLADLSCAVPQLCVGVDFNGNAVISTDPAGGTPAWTKHLVDENQDPSLPTLPFPLAGVSCPSTSFCAAADGFGGVVTTTDPVSGPTPWPRTEVFGQNLGDHLEGISCPSPSFCAASANQGAVVTSTDPSSGPWASTGPIGVEGHIECPATSFCAALSGHAVVTSTDPTGGAAAWSPTTIDRKADLSSLDCLSAHFCIAGDDAGNVLVGNAP